MKLGATHLGNGRTSFLLWVPLADVVDLLLDDGRTVRMGAATGRDGEDGYRTVVAEGVPPGTRYRFHVRPHDGEPFETADPASRHQPDGVHGPSAVVDDDFPWSTTAWSGLPLRDHVIYELHVGTFTSAGTFDAAIDRLDDLVELGVTAVEVMPVAEFPGRRNWGYDGVLPFAAQSTYGGPDGFRRLVDACHTRGLAVVLDVVYNHFGPEGAPQPDLAPYLTERYDTPWGPAINFDGPGSDGVRRYFVENARWWVDGCRVDALRLDAVHAILDRSATHFLSELAEDVHDLATRRNRRIHLIAESDLNDPRLIRPSLVGGYGLDGQWSDDFHHALHSLLTGEDDGYYGDFGGLGDLAVALRDGFVLQGQHSRYRGHRHGARPEGVAGEQLVVCAQNHDQVGNRAEGERLGHLVDLPALKVAATCTLLAPFVPLLFMGEEYADPAPFLYFVSHGDEDLIATVRRGRRDEFAAFDWTGDPPDPQADETFARSRLDWDRRRDDGHAHLLAWYCRALELRRTDPALSRLDRDRIEVVADERTKVLTWRRWTPDGEEAVVAVRLGGAEDEVAATDRGPADVAGPPTAVWALPAGRWRRALDASAPTFGGPGSGSPDRIAADAPSAVPIGPWGALVYVREASGADGPQLRPGTVGGA